MQGSVRVCRLRYQGLKGGLSYLVPIFTQFVGRSGNTLGTEPGSQSSTAEFEPSTSTNYAPFLLAITLPESNQDKHDRYVQHLHHCVRSIDYCIAPFDNVM